MEKYRAKYNAFDSRGNLRATFYIYLESDNYNHAWDEAQCYLEYEGAFTELDSVEEVF